MEKLTSIKEEGLAKIAACESLHDLQELRVLYLGKKGPIQEVMKSMKDLPKEERPAFGQQNHLYVIVKLAWSKKWKKRLKRKKLISL